MIFIFPWTRNIRGRNSEKFFNIFITTQSSSWDLAFIGIDRIRQWEVDTVGKFQWCHLHTPANVPRLSWGSLLHVFLTKICIFQQTHYKCTSFLAFESPFIVFVYQDTQWKKISRKTMPSKMCLIRAVKVIARYSNVSFEI